MKITFEVGDIVKLVNPEKYTQSFIYKENLFKIAAIHPDGIKLSGQERPLTTKDILPVKIDRTEDSDIYYAPVIAAATVLPNQPIPAYWTDDSYYLDVFEKVRIEKSDKTLLDLVREQDFEYVHEVQHFLRRRYGSDDLKINYTIIRRNRKAIIAD